MKNRIRKLLFLGMLMAFVFCMQKDTAQAAREYTLTLRAGNVGEFDVEALGEIATTKAEVNENYIRIHFDESKNYTIYDALYDGFGFVALTEADLNYFFQTYVNEQDDYLLMDVTGWCDPEKSLTHNFEVVLDYGRLVNGVSYMIYYVDAQSGESVAAPLIGRGSVGQLLELTPITIDRYASEDTMVEIVLNEEKNEIVFQYVYTGETIMVPGMTIYEIRENLIRQYVYVNEPTTITEGEDEIEEVVINEEDTPLTDESENEVEIQDEETPLFSGWTAGNTALVVLGFGIAIGLVVAIGVVATKKQKNGETEENK